MRAFLTGATGFVGGHLLDALLARGASVRCLVRDPSRFRHRSSGDVELVRGDLRDPGSLADPIRGCEWVFHCAADYRLYAADPTELYQSNVEGTRNVLAAAAEAGPARVVYTSSVGALGLTDDGTPADETTPVSLDEMVGHYKRSKFLAERVADECAADGLPVVIVNPSTPVGEADVKPTATGRLILDFLRRRVPAYVDTGLNLVDVRDVAAGHLLAAEKGRIGERYILGNRDMSLREIYRTLGRIAELPAPRLRLPHAVPLLFAAVDTGIARLTGREPRVALESVRLARYQMYFSSAKAVRELGLPQTPVEEALERAVAWFRQHGYVEA
ncbi:MAG: NAD-dependent epimerase/dehydratase family protein [Thermoanaerobaculia bacterium]|nr:NAD-dependent epimerase/dehydratase family protein [Thermoanaerobaculia bacterium]